MAVMAQEQAAAAQAQEGEGGGGEAGALEGGGFATSQGGLPGDQYEPGATSPAQVTGVDEAGNPVAG